MGWGVGRGGGGGSLTLYRRLRDEVNAILRFAVVKLNTAA